ncbi:MAG: prolipoprotein diacylglyceryl transferase [Eubacteriales bacterium]|nr:prolipoprotein diacylglyceryl transferase [Eubacteriales bacterium]
MVERVAFNIFGKDIYWYGIIMSLALLCGVLLARKTAKRAGLDPDSIFDVALLVVPLAIIGARLYYVIFMWKDFYAQQPFIEVFKMWNGGMAIYGGVIGGVIGAWIYARWKKVKMLTLLDVLAPCLILGQAIGRWGNFINQEAFGYAISNPALQFFPLAVFIEADGAYHMATFFYESAWNFLVFGFLLWATYKKKNRRDGDIFLYYLLLYGLGRMVIEGLRTDSLYFLNIRVSQWLSGIMVLLALGMLIYNARKRPKPAPAPLGPPDEAQEASASIDAPPADEDDAIADMQSVPDEQPVPKEDETDEE